MPYVCVTFGDIVIIVIILTRSARIIDRLICAIRPRTIGNEREETTDLMMWIVDETREILRYERSRRWVLITSAIYNVDVVRSVPLIVFFFVHYEKYARRIWQTSNDKSLKLRVAANFVTKCTKYLLHLECKNSYAREGIYYIPLLYSFSLYIYIFFFVLIM